MWGSRAPWLRGEVARLLAEDVPAAAAHGGERQTGRAQDGVTILSSGVDNTAEHITARLKRDDPDLAEKVVTGEVSPNAAARQKGWRKPRIVGVAT